MPPKVPKLDLFQRTVLANQYRILQLLDPNGGWDEHLEAVERGFEADYPLEEYEPLDEKQCREVADILSMYRALKVAYKELDPADQTGIDEGDLKFVGFDGNERIEGRYMSYTKYLWKIGQFTESRDDGHDGANSHLPMLETYRRMMAAYSLAKDRLHLTKEDVRRVAAARPYPRD
jgi:uncharacterized protein YfbU (UPF0304 family)